MKSVTLQEAVADCTGTIDYLTFRCYQFNRLSHPRITPAQWAKHFGEVEVLVFEAHIQEKLSHDFRSKLDRSFVARAKADKGFGAEHDFLMSLYIEIRLTFDPQPEAISDSRLRELENSYLEARAEA